MTTTHVEQTTFINKTAFVTLNIEIKQTRVNMQNTSKQIAHISTSRCEGTSARHKTIFGAFIPKIKS